MSSEGACRHAVHKFIKEEKLIHASVRYRVEYLEEPSNLFLLVIDHGLHVHVANIRVMCEIISERRVMGRETGESKGMRSELVQNSLNIS